MYTILLTTLNAGINSSVGSHPIDVVEVRRSYYLYSPGHKYQRPHSIPTVRVSVSCNTSVSVCLVTQMWVIVMNNFLIPILIGATLQMPQIGADSGKLCYLSFATCSLTVNFTIAIDIDQHLFLCKSCTYIP